MKYINRIFPLLILVFLNEGCHANPEPDPMSTGDSSAVRYVALGDSYTICEGAKENEAWPFLLANDLSAGKIPVKLIANPSRTGWTTQDLIDRELPVFDKSNADIVTLLIGVNDWVQGVDRATFKKNIRLILDHVQGKLENKKNILLITIPDFGVTPTGKNFSGGRNISNGIAEFNEVIKTEAAERGLPVVDIFELTQKMGTDTTLVAPDGLHPSAKEYAIWEKMILPGFEKMITADK